jgi:hypothetical protein
MTLGKELPASPSTEEVARALAAAIAAIKARGKSETGEKTMLDVLAPVQAELAAGGAELTARLRRRAFDAAAATTPMKALRGRHVPLCVAVIARVVPRSERAFAPEMPAWSTAKPSCASQFATGLARRLRIARSAIAARVARQIAALDALQRALRIASTAYS